MFFLLIKAVSYQWKAHIPWNEKKLAAELTPTKSEIKLSLWHEIFKYWGNYEHYSDTKSKKKTCIKITQNENFSFSAHTRCCLINHAFNAREFK